jgi:radical SAM protein (TIGR01212 family)
METPKTYKWGHSRRFNAYSEYFKKTFGERVQKLSLDAGFNCPNRDGMKGRGGCTFCNNNAFNPPYCHPSKTISRQIEEGMAFHRKRYRKAQKYLAYFQAYSNTYDSVFMLKSRYEEALENPAVVGLVIGTRPDTVSPEILDYLKILSEDHYVIIEYGLESTYNATLERVNRGHTFEDSIRAIEMTASRGLRQGAHFILGLPGETRGEMLGQVKTISALPINNIKFHQLQIVRDTVMAREYESDPSQFHLFELDEYLDLMVEVLERLNPDFVVERIAGEVQKGYQVTRPWGLRYEQVLQKFEERLESGNTWQGRRYRP